MENEAIDYNYFKLEEGNMRDYESIKNGVSKNGENIYIGGTSNFDYANPFFSSNDSWYHLIKVNEDLSPIWEYWYGGDAYYLLYSILATSDGGCIMAGIRYDDEIQNLERDIYISKVNSDGLVVWTREIEPPKSISTVYPNPGTDYFNIKTSDEASDFELINQNGQRVIKQHISEDSKQINTETLQPGMYFYKLTNQKTNTAETGKWIKNR
jgi:hypothetical protein